MATTKNNVGPIIFAQQQAREHLLDFGKVYTFRTSERTTGETWARKSRTGPKIADVTVELEAEIRERPRDAIDHPVWPAYSGYGTAEEWWQAITDVHGPVDSGYIYKVTLRDGD